MSGFGNLYSKGKSYLLLLLSLFMRLVMSTKGHNSLSNLSDLEEIGMYLRVTQRIMRSTSHYNLYVGIFTILVRAEIISIY